MTLQGLFGQLSHARRSRWEVGRRIGWHPPGRLVQIRFTAFPQHSLGARRFAASWAIRRAFRH